MNIVADKFYKKYIRIPPNESVDIRKIWSIINHPLFQRLNHISQLGTTSTVFPGAMHNRFEHSLGVYAKTLRFCQKMFQEGFLNKKQAENVPLFALLHDIGHGPFSHVIEELTELSGDENENGLEVLKEFKEAIKKAGGDYAFIRSIFAHKNPLYRIVMDKNVGMDKLDYLERDVYHTGFGQRPDIESIFNYLVYLKGNLVIDKKSLEAAKQMQKLYLYMYKEVYLHKSALISQRFLQKMMSILIQERKLDISNLWRLNDKEMFALIIADVDERLKLLYDCYRNRNLPRTGLVIRLKDREFKERVAGKMIRVIGEDFEFFNKLIDRSSPKELESLEKVVADLLNLPAHRIVIVPTVTPWRFVPQDILYHDNGKIFSLKETHKEYFESLRFEMNDYMALRICIIGDRKLIYKKATQIYKAIKQSV